MGYAIRNDHQGWRAVASVDDVLDDEYFSESPIEIPSPEPTYQSELTALNTEWQLKVDGYNKSFAIAALVDGASEQGKKAAIRAAYEADKLENTAARAALKIKYGIGGV